MDQITFWILSHGLDNFLDWQKKRKKKRKDKYDLLSDLLQENSLIFLWLSAFIPVVATAE